jgi:hypothetical protein
VPSHFCVGFHGCAVVHFYCKRQASSIVRGRSVQQFNPKFEGKVLAHKGASRTTPASKLVWAPESRIADINNNQFHNISSGALFLVHVFALLNFSFVFSFCIIC